MNFNDLRYYTKLDINNYCITLIFRTSYLLIRAISSHGALMPASEKRMLTSKDLGSFR